MRAAPPRPSSIGRRAPPRARAAARAAALGAAAALLAAAPAAAQSVNAGVKGRLVSRTITAAALSTAPLYVTEPKGSFVLTQICTADASAGDEAVLTGNTIGRLVTHGQNQACRSYEPGFVVPANETLTCDNTANDFPLVCTITGIQTPK